MADNQRALMLALAERERRARDQAAADGGQPRDQAAEEGGQPRGALREFASDVNRMASQFTAGAMSLTPRFVQEPLIERGLIIDPSEAPSTAVESAFRYMGAAAPIAAGGAAAGARALSTAPGQIMQSPGIVRGILQDIGRFAQSSPGIFYGSEMAGAAGAGLAGHVAREGDAGPIGQLSAEALGGLTAGGLTAAVPTAARGVRDAVLANLAP